MNFTELVLSALIIMIVMAAVVIVASITIIIFDIKGMRKSKKKDYEDEVRNFKN